MERAMTNTKGAIAENGLRGEIVGIDWRTAMMRK